MIKASEVIFIHFFDIIFELLCLFQLMFYGLSKKQGSHVRPFSLNLPFNGNAVIDVHRIYNLFHDLSPKMLLDSRLKLILSQTKLQFSKAIVQLKYHSI